MDKIPPPKKMQEKGQYNNICLTVSCHEWSNIPLRILFVKLTFNLVSLKDLNSFEEKTPLRCLVAVIALRRGKKMQIFTWLSKILLLIMLNVTVVETLYSIICIFLESAWLLEVQNEVH